MFCQFAAQSRSYLAVSTCCCTWTAASASAWRSLARLPLTTPDTSEATRPRRRTPVRPRARVRMERSRYECRWRPAGWLGVTSVVLLGDFHSCTTGASVGSGAVRRGRLCRGVCPSGRRSHSRRTNKLSVETPPREQFSACPEGRDELLDDRFSIVDKAPETALPTR